MDSLQNLHKKLKARSKPTLVVDNTRSNKRRGRVYVATEEDFNKVRDFVFKQPDTGRITINASFVKALYEEIILLREQHKNRLQVLHGGRF